MTKVVDQIEDMGYTREEAMNALRDNHWDMEAALDALEGEEIEMVDENNDGFQGGLEGELNQNFLQLLTDPTFKHIRDQIRENPDNAQILLEQLRDVRPDIYEYLQDHPDDLEDLINNILEGSSINNEDDWEDDGEIANQPGRRKELLRSSRRHSWDAATYWS